MSRLVLGSINGLDTLEWRIFAEISFWLIVLFAFLVRKIVIARKEKREKQRERERGKIQSLNSFLCLLDYLQQTALYILNECEKPLFVTHKVSAELEEKMKEDRLMEIWSQGHLMNLACIRRKNQWLILDKALELEKVDKMTFKFWNAISKSGRKYFIGHIDEGLEEIRKSVADYQKEIKDIELKVKERYAQIIEIN